MVLRNLKGILFALLLTWPVTAVWGEETAQLKFNGTPTVGSRITLKLDGVSEPDTSYLWVQVEGPPVTIDDPTKPTIELTIPPKTERLGFEVVLKSNGATKTRRVTIPVGGAPDPNAPKADAGDDTIGLAGHKVTLNGACRTPAGRVGYRWFQLAGPRIDQAVQDRAYYAFTPTAAGVYRFALVVATSVDGSAPAVSEPDEVVVNVGEPPVVSPVNPYAPTAPTANPLDQAIRASRSFTNHETLDKVAGAFDSIAERATLYSSFAEMTSELMRRLDTVIPADPGSRQVWVQGVFAPLTQYTVGEMRSVGLELGYSQGFTQELNAVQKEKLRTLFSLYSREFRSRSLSR